MKRSLLAVAIVTGSLLGVSALYRHLNPEDAGTRIPSREEEVLETVPTRLKDPLYARIEELRRLMAAKPEDVQTAVELAKLQIQLGRSQGDPRRLGYAQAALKRWWALSSPPEDVLLLRATLEQSLHAFPEALADLDRLLRTHPDNPQAWLTRAVVLAVRGDYAGAEASCRPLAALAGPFVETVCLTNAQSLHGDSKGAYQRLSLALRQQSEDLSISEQTWALSTLADAAAHAGDGPAVEENLARALALDPKDHFLQAMYADFLLDAGRPSEVLALLKDGRQDDGLLLRYVLAAHSLGQGAEDADELRTRYEATHLRGDSLHRREEARFVLAVEDDARRALALARANWEVQHEPWDARILLEAAIAARKPDAAAPVLTALRENHTEDPTLQGLARRVQELRP